MQGGAQGGLRASAARNHHLQDGAGVLHPHPQAVQAHQQDCVRLVAPHTTKTKPNTLILDVMFEQIVQKGCCYYLDQ